MVLELTLISESPNLKLHIKVSKLETLPGIHKKIISVSGQNHFQ